MLVADPHPVPSSLLTALGLVALERRPDLRFRVLAPTPGWFDGLFTLGDNALVSPGEDSHFLASFLPIAEEVWDGAGGERLMSGPYTEAGADGLERTLEATALRDDGRDWLLLGPPMFPFGTTQRLLQTARDERLGMERARRRNQERELLLHCIVHDLSNPLAALRGGLSMMDDRTLTDDDREMLQIARRQSDKMKALIGDVLAIFRREVDAMMPATALPVDAGAVLRQSADALRLYARDNEVTLSVDLPEHPLSVIAEAERLERALLNFIENAIRHSPAGGTVRLAAYEDGSFIRMSVEDEGPGVPPEARRTLFQRFTSGGPSPGKAGLGLYVCRLSAESWGGSVGYEDREGGGARFWIRLLRPRARLAEGVHAREA